MGKTTGPVKNGFDLPRGAGNMEREEAQGDHPRSAQRPEPRGRAASPGDSTRFHNRVVDTQLGGVPDAQKFATAREIVTKHYQWMIRTDYLPRICKAAVVNNVFNQGRKAFEVGVIPTDIPTMPIEFSIAGFASATRWSAATTPERDLRQRQWDARPGCSPSPRPAAISAVDTRLASIWIADFRRLYDFGEANKPPARGPGGQVQPGDADRQPHRGPAPAPAPADGRAVAEHRLQRVRHVRRNLGISGTWFAPAW